jgi:hypothetical protein
MVIVIVIVMERESPGGVERPPKCGNALGDVT